VTNAFVDEIRNYRSRYRDSNDREQVWLAGFVQG
jgi:hypothetical protein